MAWHWMKNGYKKQIERKLERDRDRVSGSEREKGSEIVQVCMFVCMFEPERDSKLSRMCSREREGERERE